MALTGTLDSVPLSEVLRMLARSGKTGCLRVDAGGLPGRIYVAEGRVTYATVRRDEDLRVDLLNAKMVDERSWQRIEQREASIQQILADGFSAEDFTNFITEQITDVIFRISRPGHGTFDFGEEITPHYPTDQRIDVEICLRDAEARINQWRSIEEVIPGVNFRLRMAPHLPSAAADVRITGDTWRLLAALAGQGTVEDVAERLGATDFHVAQAMAQMVRQGLLEVVDQLAPARYSYGEGETVEPTVELGMVEEVPRDVANLEPEIRIASLSGPDPLTEPLFEPEVEPEPEDESDTDLLQSVLSNFQGGEDDEDDPDTTERVLGRRKGLGALARELSDFNEG